MGGEDMDKLDSSAGNEWRAPDQKPDDYRSVIRNSVEFQTFSGSPPERPFVYDEDATYPMRNTMHARIEALRAARLAFWVAVIDSLPVFIVRALVGFLNALNNMIDSGSRLIMRATRRLFGVKDE